MRIRLFSIALCLLATSRLLQAQGSAEDYRRARVLDELLSSSFHWGGVWPRWEEGEASFWFRIDEGAALRVDTANGHKSPLYDKQALDRAMEKAGLNPPGELVGVRIQGTGVDLWFDSEDRIVRWDPKHSRPLSFETLEVSQSFRLKALEFVPRSRDLGGAARIVFFNRTPRPLALRWMNRRGSRQRYATIGPGQSVTQSTFQGHAWLLVDEEKAPRAAFVAGEGASIAWVDENTRIPKSPPYRIPGISPDGLWRAITKKGDLYLREMESGVEHRITHDAQASNAFRNDFHWAPDSRHFVAVKLKRGDQRTIHLIESSPPRQLQPKLHTLRYSKPGDRIDHPSLWLVDIATFSAKEIPSALYPNPWSLSRFHWEEDSRSFSFLYNQRGHQILRIVRVAVDKKTPTLVMEERSKTFIDYAGKLFLEHLPKTHEFVWMSERSGWNHLWLVDARSGAARPITKGPWVVRSVERIDAVKRELWFWGSGMNPGEDPYHLHFCRVNLDGSGFRVLTAGDGTHEVEISPEGRFFIDSWSRVDLPPRSALREMRTGKLICKLAEARVERLEAAGFRYPERFVAKGRDGKTDIHGVIYRPTRYHKNDHYPVIESIYAGPQGASVPKTFAPFREQQRLAELGFIVVQIDGMGTSYRSKAFHDVCWKNLGDAGFPDRIAWIRAAAKNDPAMDLERIGIYGGSAGGQNALRALLAHPKFYRVAVADCGCHDNRMDKIWWNELWMGWPIGPHYAEQSNVTQAYHLEGKLLLIVGELDRNVDPASTMQVVHALIHEDKDFDLLVMPGRGHGAGNSPYARRRREDFFVRHLLGREPRW